MVRHGPLHVLLYRPPWRNNEPYFRAQQVGAHFRHAGAHVHVVGGPHGWSSLSRLLAWPRCLLQADIVFLYPQPLMPLFALTAKALGRRVAIDHYVSYVRLADVSPRSGLVLAPLEKAAYQQADAVLAHSASVARALRKVHGLSADKLHTVYSLVDTNHFAPSYADEAALLRRDLGLSDRFVVLYHGLWNHWHGLETLRTAVADLAEAGESVSLVLIGRAGAGAPHERLLDEVAYAQLPPHIQMADVWCSGFRSLPRGDRSFSSTMIQALALARPVITSPSPEKTRFLRHGETAFFVPPDSPSALAQEIRNRRRHPDATSRVGRAGRCLAQRAFDLADFQRLLQHLTRTWFDA